jgi:hypothetical protein
MTSQRRVVHNPAGVDLEFEGELVAETQAADVGTVKVYRTLSGKLVARQHRVAFRGRSAIDRIGVFESEHELSQWIGHSPGAKAILEQLGHPVRKQLD